jgi:hypothetical protein
METFTITELSYAFIAMSGGLGALLMIVWKSRCKTVKLCYGCVKCDREVLKEENFRPSPVVTNDEYTL